MTAQVLLMVILLGGGGTREHPFPTMDACERAIQTSHMKIPSGAENERGAVLVCVYQDARPPWWERLDNWAKERGAK
jgi:hypothetical protein